MAVTRRTVMIAPLLLPVFKETAGASERNNYFLEESGSTHQDARQSPFVTGMMQVKEKDEVEEKIREIRQENSFLCQFSYHTTNKFKLASAIELIDLFVSSDSMSLNLFSVSDLVSKPWPEKKSDNEVAYNRHCRKFAEQTVQNENAPTLFLEKRSLSGRDISLMTDLKFSFGDTISIERVSGKNNDLLQLCDLLTGCAYFFQQERNGKVNPVKQEIAEYFLQSVGASDATDFQKSGAFKNVKLTLGQRL